MLCTGTNYGGRGRRYLLPVQQASASHCVADAGRGNCTHVMLSPCTSSIPPGLSRHLGSPQWPSMLPFHRLMSTTIFLSRPTIFMTLHSIHPPCPWSPSQYTPTFCGSLLQMHCVWTSCKQTLILKWYSTIVSVVGNENVCDLIPDKQVTGYCSHVVVLFTLLHAMVDEVSQSITEEEVVPLQVTSSLW